MPTLEQKSQSISTNPPLLRLLFYGAPKTRKTWLAGTAAEAGFNTILLDSDHGYHILLKNLSDAAKKRLMVIESTDSLKKANASVFLTTFLKSGKVNFDEATKQILPIHGAMPESAIQLSIDNHLNYNTVLIIDSYTALVKSLTFRYAIENKIDLTDAAKPEWDGYAWCGALATWMLEKLSQLPCHVIVIGHKSIYEKRGKDSRGKEFIEYTRTQVKSTSAPHSMTIGDKFTDILIFDQISSIATKISTRADKNIEGGSRLIPPDIYDWKDLQFKNICEFAGIHLPPEDLPYLNFSIPEPKENTLSKNKSPEINPTITGKKKVNIFGK